MKRKLLHRISDVSKDKQTDNLKVEVYNLIRQFVYKEWRHYHPHIMGDQDALDDLVSDFFIDFITPKGRGEKKESLLDKWDPEKQSLPVLVKVCVIRKLIDAERGYKFTVRATENYDDESGIPSLDYLFQSLAEEQDEYEELTLTPEIKKSIKDKYSNLSKGEKDSVKRKFNRLKDKLDEQFIEFFNELFNESNPLIKELKSKFNIDASEKQIKSGNTISFKSSIRNVDVDKFLESKGFIWLKDYKDSTYYINR